MILHAKQKVRSEINQTDDWIIARVKCWCANDTEEIDASPPHLYKYDDELSWKLVCPQKHVLVAGKTEPSQVFERGLVPFNQLLRREFSQQ